MHFVLLVFSSILCICLLVHGSSLEEPGLDPSKCSNPGDWSKLGHSCFTKVHKNRVSWDEAQVLCESLGANLPVVHSPAATVFLKRTLSHYKRTLSYDTRTLSYDTQTLSRYTHPLVWIGAKGLGIQENSRYAWLNKFPMCYSNWLDLQPQPVSEDNNCVAANTAGKWIVQDCSKNLPFLCEYSTRNCPNISSESQWTCPNSSIEWMDLNVGTNCYHISTTEETFIDAMRLCVFQGGSLASFHSSEELDTIAPFLVALDWTVYIGLAKKIDGSFGWVDNSAVDYVHWQEGEPNLGERSCVEMDPTFLTWNDIKCEEKRHYICSASKVPNPYLADGMNNLTSYEEIVDPLPAGGILSVVIYVVGAMILIGAFSYGCVFIYSFIRDRKASAQGLSRLTAEHNF